MASHLARLFLATAVLVVVSFHTRSGRAQSAQPRPDYVATPSGWRHKSCVHEIPDGAEVSEEPDGRYVVRGAGRALQRLAKCQFPAIAANEHVTTEQRQSVEPAATGWVLSTEGNLDPNAPTRHLTKVTGAWRVPPAPRAQWNQVVFFFNGVANECTLYQPVLQWGNSGHGGGNYWSMSNWIAPSGSCGGSLFHGPYRRVNVGDVSLHWDQR